MQSIIREKLLPEFNSLLFAKDPLPAYAVRLLDTLLEHWPRYCIMKQINFVHLFKTFSLLSTLDLEFKFRNFFARYCNDFIIGIETY